MKVKIIKGPLFEENQNRGYQFISKVLTKQSREIAKKVNDMHSILIEVHYTINDMKALRRGYFNVHPKKFRENPDEAAAEVAKQFIREMRREYIYKIEINKVLYDSNDITEIILREDINNA